MVAETTLEQAGNTGLGDAMVQDSPNSRIVPPPVDGEAKHLQFKPYGVGIDCHSRFIVITVLRRNATETTRTSKFAATM
jgi:hypothetical protein